MVIINKNEFYQLSVDRELNRIFFKMRGGWASRKEVPQYIADWKKVLSLIQPGFTILSDTRGMKRHSAEVEQLHVQVQRFIIEAGIYQVAEVHVMDEAVLDQIMYIAQFSNFPLNLFDSRKDAERWLEEITNAVVRI